MNDKLIRLLLPFGTLLLFFIIMAVFGSGGFFSFNNFMNVLERSSIYIIVGVGMTFVIITAGFDLSVGSMMGLSAMTGAFLMNLMIRSWVMGRNERTPETLRLISSASKIPITMGKARSPSLSLR